MDLLNARLTELVLTVDPAMHTRLSGLMLAYAFLLETPPPALWTAAIDALDAEASQPQAMPHRIKLLWSMALADSGAVPLHAVQDVLACFYQRAASPSVQSVDIARLLTVLELVADRLPALIAELKNVDRTLTMLEASAPSAVGLPQLKQALMLFEGVRYVPTRKFLALYAVQLEAVLAGIGTSDLTCTTPCEKCRSVCQNTLPHNCFFIRPCDAHHRSRCLGRPCALDCRVCGARIAAHRPPPHRARGRCRRLWRRGR